MSCREVVEPYDNPGRSIILVTLADSLGNQKTIKTTDNHPFYVDGKGWTRVDHLNPGDFIPSADRGLLTVTALEWTPRVETVYNFGVDEFHTYFVGAVGAWVHNCLTNSEQKIAKKLGHSVKDVKDAIHELKAESKIGGSRRNPDVLVDTANGDVYILDPKTGKPADMIDNIFNYLPDSP